MAMPIGPQHAHPGTPAPRVMPPQEPRGAVALAFAPGSGVLCGASALAFVDAMAEAKTEDRKEEEAQEAINDEGRA